MPYSVLTEGVIPVIMPNGESKNVGIREALLQAHNLQDLGGDTPLEKIALLRLLVAFSMDMMHLETAAARKALLNRGCFEERLFEEYIAICEKDGPRFDLFDKEHPFMQSAYDEELDSNAKKPVASLFIDIPSGNNHIFIDHRTEDAHEVDFASAFRAMLALYTTCTAGAQGYPSCVNNTPPVYTYLTGSNLFQTIVLNMLSVNEAYPLTYGFGDAAWRKDEKIIPKAAEVPAVSLIQAYTFIPRRITLIPTERNTILEVYLQQGMNFKGNDNWIDPFVPQIKKKDGDYATIKPNVDRALWRDVGALLYEQHGKTTRQPKNLKCSFNNLNYESTNGNITAAGVVTNNAQYVLWMEEKFIIPEVLMENEEAADLFREDIAMVEQIQNSMFRIVGEKIDTLRNGSKSTNHSIADQCRTHFLVQMRTLLFGEYLSEITAGLDEKIHVQHFHEAIKCAMIKTIRDVIRTSGNTGKDLIKQMEAEKEIWSSYSHYTMERMKEFE